MKPLTALVLGVVAYGVFVAATVPASVVARQVAEASAGKIRITEASGTLWEGSASVEVDAQGLEMALDAVRWRFLPQPLLAGRLGFAVEGRSVGLDARAQLSRGFSGWEAREVRVNGDASTIASWYSPVAALQPAGALAIESARLQWDDRQATGTATAEWREASFGVSPVRPLGSWRAQATAQGKAAEVKLETMRGPLRLAGTGTLTFPARFVFSGEARAEPGHERDLEALLDLLGPRRADGAHALEVR